MNEPTLICQDERRRHKVRQHRLNGLDYVEVEHFEDGKPLDQPRLRAYFLGKAPEQEIKAAHIRIEGGRRIPGSDIAVVGDPEIVRSEYSDLDDVLKVTLDRSGDFSNYTFRLVDLDSSGRPTDQPFPGFDRRYDRLLFNFKIDCPSDLDCKTDAVCPPEKRDQPEINYLAKDYASFRQLIFDRLALIMPDWRERHVPDLGVALVELLAYMGDQLSYYQDAVATEAYLDTARQRISVRRHVRLVDYRMHEGCNARAWVAIETNSDLTIKPEDFFFIVDRRDDSRFTGATLDAADLRNVLAEKYDVFEPLVEREGPVKLFAEHSRINFYTWGDQECCLAKGATTAILQDKVVVPPPSYEPQPSYQSQPPYQQPSYQPQASYSSPPSYGREPKPPEPDEPPPPARKLHLQPGDVLIFEEVIGPKTDDPADADPAHRHAVRLTRVTPITDALFDPAVPLVEIEWAAEDALPFTLCISTIGPAPECKLLANVSVARGNVVLVDHGRSIVDEPLGMVGVASTKEVCEAEGRAGEISFVPKRFRLQLKRSPVTFSEAVIVNAPASRSLNQEPRNALAQVKLKSIPGTTDENDLFVALFSLLDLKDPTSLAITLRVGANQRVRFLRGLLSGETQKLLAEYPEADGPPAALLQRLTNELAQLVDHWSTQFDLLDGTGQDHRFVTEIDNDAGAHLRFGDGELGKLPDAGTTFSATYRVGNGPAGNVGPEAISRLVFRQTVSGSGIRRVRNLLAAQGGISPEPIAEVKLFAPYALRNDLQRAITGDDYVALVERDFPDSVQRAAAALRWTGSWYEAQLAVDPLGAEETSEAFRNRIKERLYRFRRMGHDVAVRPARYVPLEIELTVCVKPHYLRGHVEAALLDLFSNRTLPDGRLGFFHPDNLSFGDDVFLSKLTAVAQSVVGVQSVEVTTLNRLNELPNSEIENGVLPLGPGEICQVDNDPSFPERGRMTLVMRGGR